MLEPKLAVNIPNPCGQQLRLPIGNIHLQAFDYDIDLQKLTDEVASLIQHFNTRVAELIGEELDKTAEKNNIDKAKVHANAAADMFLALWEEIN